MERINLEQLKPGNELLALKITWVKCKVYFIGWFSIVLEDMEGSKKGILWWDKRENLEDPEYYRPIK